MLSARRAPSRWRSWSIARATPGPSERDEGIRPIGARDWAPTDDESESEPDWHMSEVSEMAERWRAPLGGGRSEARVFGEAEWSYSESETPPLEEKELFC